MKESKTEEKAGKSKAPLLAIILVGLVLVGGNVFFASGFFATKDAATDFYDEISSKEETISAYEKKTGIPRETIRSTDVAPEQPKESPVIEEDEEVVESEEPVTISSDYIYFPDYGIKLKKSSSLTSVSYRYENIYGWSTVYFWGVKKGTQYFPQYADPHTNAFGGLVAISIIPRARYEEMDTRTMGAIAYEDDDYIVTYSGSQSVFSSDSHDIEVEKESREAAIEWLSNKENYSRI